MFHVNQSQTWAKTPQGIGIQGCTMPYRNVFWQLGPAKGIWTFFLVCQ